MYLQSPADERFSIRKFTFVLTESVIFYGGITGAASDMSDVTVSHARYLGITDDWTFTKRNPPRIRPLGARNPPLLQTTPHPNPTT